MAQSSGDRIKGFTRPSRFRSLSRMTTLMNSPPGIDAAWPTTATRRRRPRACGFLNTGAAPRATHIYCAARPDPSQASSPWRQTLDAKLRDMVGSWVVAQLELHIIFEFCCKKKMASLLRAL